MSETSKAGQATSGTDLRERMYRAEHLEVAGEYLADRLPIDVGDIHALALVSRAVQHHLASLARSQSLSVRLTSAPFGDGLAISVSWPEEPLINAVRISVELHERGTVSEEFARTDGSGNSGILGRFRALASDRTFVLRPFTEATQITISATPGHRVRVKGQPTSGRLGWSPAPEDCVEGSSFAYVPDASRSPSVIDVYRNHQGRQNVYELVDMEAVLRQIARNRRRVVRRRIRTLSIVIGVALLLSAIVLGVLMWLTPPTSRFSDRVPTWMPRRIEAPDPDTESLQNLSDAESPASGGDGSLGG